MTDCWLVLNAAEANEIYAGMMEFGRHSGFKIRRFIPCGFESHYRHQMERWLSG